MKKNNTLSIMVALIVALGLVKATHAQSNEQALLNIDALSGATQIDYDNPYFVSNQQTIFDSSNTQSNPHYKTTAEKIPTINDDSLKTFYIKNTGNKNGGTMNRKCTLRGSLSDTGSDRLAIALWADGKPVVATSDLSAQPSKDQPFVFVKTNSITREIRFQLANEQQINLSLGCYSKRVGANYTVQLKCTGNDRDNTIFTYTDSRIWCKVDEKVANPVIIKDGFEQD